MSSQHDDYVNFHNTVNAQNRSNYEVKYRLIERVPLAIIAISGLYNVFAKENWNWGIGIFTLLAIIYSLVTYIFLYDFLEAANTMNMQWLEIASKNQNLPTDKQIKKTPAGYEKYKRLDKWVERSYKISIYLCILLILTIGGSFMSVKDTKSKTTKVVHTQDNSNKGAVSRPIVPKEPDSIDQGAVTAPIEPKVDNPDISQPKQPDSNPDSKPETPKTEPPAADKSEE